MSNAESCRIRKDNRMLKEERGNKCQICKWDKANCDVHHIVPRKDGGTEEWTNKIVLCPNCHRMTHHGIITEEELKEYIGLLV